MFPNLRDAISARFSANSGESLRRPVARPHHHIVLGLCPVRSTTQSRYLARSTGPRRDSSVYTALFAFPPSHRDAISAKSYTNFEESLCRSVARPYHHMVVDLCPVRSTAQSLHPARCTGLAKATLPRVHFRREKTMTRDTADALAQMIFAVQAVWPPKKNAEDET
jgi:hypothetical protein